MDETHSDKNTKKKKKTKKALARLRRTLAKKETLEGDAALSAWEDDFTQSLEQRLEKFGSAFVDPQKGAADEALSYRQAVKLREIEKKAAGKARKPMKRGGFKHKKSLHRQKDSAQIPSAEGSGGLAPLEQKASTSLPPPTGSPGPPKLTIILGGKKEP